MKYICFYEQRFSHDIPSAESVVKKLFRDIGLDSYNVHQDSKSIIFDSPEGLDEKELRQRLEDRKEKEFKIGIFSSNDIIRIAEALPEGWVDDVDQRSEVFFLAPILDTASTVMQIGYNSDIETALYVPKAILWNIPRNHLYRSSIESIESNAISTQLFMRSTKAVRELANMLHADA